LVVFYDNVQIKKFKVLNNELTKDRLYIRNKVVDILVDIGTKVINIEVNVKYDDYRIYRNFFYLAPSTIASMKKDIKFVDIKEHVQFNFNFKKNYKKKWYNSGKQKEYYEKFKSIIMFGLADMNLRIWRIVMTI